MESYLGRLNNLLGIKLKKKSLSESMWGGASRLVRDRNVARKNWDNRFDFAYVQMISSWYFVRSLKTGGGDNVFCLPGLATGWESV